MQKIVYAVLATLSGLVLIFSYRTSLDAVQPMAITEPAATNGAAAPSPTASGSSSSGSASPTAAASDAAPGATPPDPAAPTASGLADGTYSGGAVSTRYGPVRVQIAVAAGQIADVQVTDHPDSSSTDRQINAYAIPILVAETTQAQSAQIDMVSGASYTSQGYVRSLQSAIDQARS